MMKLKHSLYQEHVQNLSAVYDQMVWLKEKDRIPWPDFRRRDELLEAHVHGLVLGGAEALGLCVEKAVDGDVGEGYGAVRVLIRKKEYPLLKHTVCRMDLITKDRLDSVVRAFGHEQPDKAMENAVRDFFGMQGALTQLAARIAGYHRFDTVENLYGLIKAPDTGKTILSEDLTCEGEMTDDRIMTAGMVGEPSVIPDLIDLLDHETFSENAALSLNLITGAGLTEEIFVPDEIDGDFLTPQEAELYSQGIMPGKTVTRISRNPDHWLVWWTAEHNRFHPGIHYRLGEPLSPLSLYQILASKTHPSDYRKMSADELSIRYGLNFTFDPWMSVKSQRRLIKDLYDPVQQAMGRFKEGVLYYQTRPVNGEDALVHHS